MNTHHGAFTLPGSASSSDGSGFSRRCSCVTAYIEGSTMSPSNRSFVGHHSTNKAPNRDCCLMAMTNHRFSQTFICAAALTGRRGIRDMVSSRMLFIRSRGRQPNNTQNHPRKATPGTVIPSVQLHYRHSSIRSSSIVNFQQRRDSTIPRVRNQRQLQFRNTPVLRYDSS